MPEVPDSIRPEVNSDAAPLFSERDLGPLNQIANPRRQIPKNDYKRGLPPVAKTSFCIRNEPHHDPADRQALHLHPWKWGLRFNASNGRSKGTTLIHFDQEALTVGLLTLRVFASARAHLFHAGDLENGCAIYRLESPFTERSLEKFQARILIS